MTLSEGRVALVTSGSHGLGRAVAETVAAAGVRVAIGYSRPSEASALLPDGLKAAGATAHHGSVSSVADCDRVVEEVLEAHGRLDILVNLAQRGHYAVDTPVMNLEPGEWDSLLRVNLTSVFSISRSALAPMLAQGYGRIVHVLGPVGPGARPGQAHYAAARAGVLALVRALAREVAGHGVTVNAFTPGLLDDDFVTVLPEDVVRAARNEVATGTLGRPEDVGSLLAVLVSEEAGYLTGQCIAMDGGLSL